MKHNKIKTLILTGLIAVCSAFPAFARNRVWVTGYEQRNNYTIFKFNNSYTYYLNYDSNGAYVPYDPETMTGVDVANAMKNGFPQYQAWSGDDGWRMSRAAFRVDEIAGLKSTMVKYICDRSELLNVDIGTDLVAGRTNVGHPQGLTVEFRFAGLTIDYEGRGTMVENPGFPADTMFDGNIEFEYDKQDGTKGKASYNGTTGYKVFAPIMDWIDTTSPNTNVTGAVSTIYNDDKDKRKVTFEQWADTPKGAVEKANIIAHLMPKHPEDSDWTETANRYIEIDGDSVNSESAVTLYATCWNQSPEYDAHEVPCDMYRSWVIPKRAKKNVAVTAIIIRDGSGTELGRSIRVQNNPNSIGYAYGNDAQGVLDEIESNYDDDDEDNDYRVDDDDEFYDEDDEDEYEDDEDDEDDDE